MTAPTITRSSYSAAVQQVRSQIVAYAEAVWAAATLQDETIRQLVDVFAPAVQAAQLSVANLTSVYLADATNTEPVPVSDEVLSGRGTPNDIVYARPVVMARTLVAEGKTLDKAFRAGARRLESLATTDLQMAKVRQAQRSFADTEVQFYRRVPTGNETCALCLIASTQRYRKQDLLPLHPGCDCDVDVIPDGMDLDATTLDLLNTTHAQVKDFTGIADRGGRAVDYRKLLVTRQHGEMGPVIAWRDQKFTGPADI